MGIKLNDIKAKTKTSSIQWDGEEVAFSYFPNFLTPELEDVMEEEESDFVADAFSKVLDWWDVLDDEGNRIPPSAEMLKAVPSRFIMTIWAKINEEQNPPE